MGKKLRKKVLAGVLASMMLVGIAPTKVFAAEDVVSKEKLEIIVQEEVNKLDFNNLGIDKVIEGIKLLIEKGVKIYSSSMCIDHYDLRNKVLVGIKIDMNEIVDIMNEADQLIKI